MVVKIQYIGHSAFKISTKGKSLLIDPFITGNPLAANVDLNVHDILVTHGHGDHLGDSLELSKKYNSPITAIFELANYCAKKGAKVQGINMGGKVPFEWGNAVWLPAAHSSGTPDGTYGGEPASILVNIDGISIYHAGDTGLHYDLKMVGEFYKPDIALLPIGGYFTMGVDEAVKAAEWLGSKKIIPMHYDTFPPIKADVEDFKKKINAIGAECIILKSGDILEV
jgi:L-ascorbate metabolism protein UlaG (beta-lactamase superfamily)